MPTPYSHFSPGFDSNGNGQRRVRTGNDRRRSRFLQKERDVSAPEVISAARGVGQEMAQRDVAARGACLRIAVGVEAFEHHGICEFGQHRLDRRVQRQLALFELAGMAQAPVIALVMEAIQTTVSAVIGSPEGAPACRSRLQKRAVSRRGRRDDAGHGARIQQPLSAQPQSCSCSASGVPPILLGPLWGQLRVAILAAFVAGRNRMAARALTSARKRGLHN